MRFVFVRHLIFLGGLLLAVCAASAPACAQRPSVAPSDSAAQAARDDTAIAVQRLFQQRRHESLRTLLTSTLLAGTTAYALTGYHPETTYQRVSTAGLLAVSGYNVVRMGVALGQRWRFRAQREEALLGQLDQGQALPRWVRRRLAPAYFGAQRRPD